MATFDDLTIDHAGVGFYLILSTPDLVSTRTQDITVTAAGPAHAARGAAALGKRHRQRAVQR